MEYIDRHGPGADIGKCSLPFGHQHQYCKGHKCADGIADDPAEDAGYRILPQKFIAVASVEDFYRQLFVPGLQNQKDNKGHYTRKACQARCLCTKSCDPGTVTVHTCQEKRIENQDPGDA